MPKANAPKWVITLRTAVAGQFPKGWLLSEQSGKVKLTIKYSDGSRSSGMLPHEWKPASHTEILNSLNAVRAAWKQGALLKEAIAAHRQRLDGCPRRTRRTELEELTERFKLTS